MLVGQVITTGDYRSPKLRILTDPLHPKEAVEIPKSEVELSRESDTSPMPTGLLNTLTEAEVLDLIAYLRSGGRAS